ncbi:MAG: hypothetical protein ACR2OL_07560 [Anderseniella sp.]
MRKTQSANAAFGAMAIALAGAIAIVATPVAAAVSAKSGFSAPEVTNPAATTRIAETKEKKKKKKTRYPAGKGS